MSDAAIPLLLLAASFACIALALRSGRAADPMPGMGQDRLWRLPILRDMVADPDLALKMKRTGRAGMARLRSHVLARILLPMAALALGLIWLALFPTPDRPPAWSMAFLACLGLIGYVAPGLYLSHLIRQRQTAFRSLWPDALDLMLLSVEAGLSLEAAMAEVARRMEPRAPVIAAELHQTLAELAYLSDRAQAFSNLAARVDMPAVRIVTAALIQAERYGTPISDAMRAMARDSRSARMADAERRAAGLPPRLTVPMILFFLPVLFAVIFTPGIILYLSDL